jgi:hypothetical protein
MQGQLLAAATHRYVTTVFELSEENFVHKQWLEGTLDDTIHLASTVLGGETTLQEQLVCLGSELHGNLTCRESFGELFQFLV